MSASAGGALSRSLLGTIHASSDVLSGHAYARACDERGQQMANGPTFDTSDPTRTDHLVIYSVYANGKAPLNRRNYDPAGLYVGRVWFSGTAYGWTAAPRRTDGGLDSWQAESMRATRYLRSKREACVFLWGVFHGVADRARQESIARIPGMVGSE